MTVQRVSLKVTPVPTLRPQETAPDDAIPLLDRAPTTILGAAREIPMVDRGVKPGRATCFGPRGVAWLSGNRLVIADTGHHRLLGWNQMPHSDETPADWQFGQPDFSGEGRNGGGDVGPLSLNVPTGVCAAGAGLAVADAWNHRVLIWNETPQTSQQPPDRVLGQADFVTGVANRGRRERAGANAMNWPYGIFAHEEKLFVSDAKNRRVLIFDHYGYEERNGPDASTVLGQLDFDTCDENAGHAPDAMSMRWPHAIAVWQGRLCVADAGNNRIMVWDGIPAGNGAPCRWVLGQNNSHDVDHNQSLYWPRATTVNMPYGMAAHGNWLLVADTANSRLLGWHCDDLASGAPARALAGQHLFHDKGDNRWQAPATDSFCWPYGLGAMPGGVIVADSGNNRVSLWNLAV